MNPLFFLIGALLVAFPNVLHFVVCLFLARLAWILFCR
jgi:hypothetical protein